MRKVRRVFVAAVGVAVLAIGIALVVLPGPAVLVIPAGLAILAIEFAWARRWLLRTKEFYAKTRKVLFSEKNNPSMEDSAMTRSICPHCGAKLDDFLYADACPHCREELKHNTKPLVPVQGEDPAQPKSWPVRTFLRIARLVKS